ncbi:MAG: biotin--[acetyl-CoA-carboxylase] ligase [Planctomycetota bacterium]
MKSFNDTGGKFDVDALNAEEIFRQIGRQRVIGCTGEIHQTVSSTMDLAKTQARTGVPDGYVVLAEEQTHGRGRDGSWTCSPQKGILMTTVLHAGLSRKDRRLLSIIGPLAATEVVRDSGVEAWIKWPNDIVVVDSLSPLSLRKIGGTLIEQSARGDAAPTHLLGLGLNVNQQSEELTDSPKTAATSLRIENGGRAVERNRLCRRLLDSLDEWYGALCHGKKQPLLKRWQELNCLVGNEIRVKSRNTILRGYVQQMCISGELLLQTSDNQTHRLSPETTRVLLDD